MDKTCVLDFIESLLDVEKNSCSFFPAMKVVYDVVDNSIKLGVYDMVCSEVVLVRTDYYNCVDF